MASIPKEQRNDDVRYRKDDPGATMIIHHVKNVDMMKALKDPNAFVGSDAFPYIDSDGKPLSWNAPYEEARGHPRGAGAGLDLFTQPDLRKAALEDFKKQTKGQPYKSLNELPKPPGGELVPDERHQYECCIHGALEHFGIVEQPQQ